MPDFAKLLEETKQSNQDIQNGIVPEPAPNEEETKNLPQDLSSYYGKEEQVVPETPPVTGNQLGASTAVAVDQDAAAADIYNQNQYGDFAELNKPNYVDPESWSADQVYKDFFSRSGENIMFGLGTMVGSFGDVAQAVGGLATGDWDGNAVSRVLQEAGEDIQQQWTGYVPEEMLDPKFKVSTFMNPEFWAIHGARFVPQLLEILATYGMASGVKKGLQYGAKKLLKSKLDDVARVTTKGVHLGSDVVQEVATKGRKGWISKVMTDQGTFTKRFGHLIETTAAGSLTNLRVSLANAGEMYNTYAELEDDNGNKLFNEQELGEMSSGAFSNNMAYIGMDILSWGMTFGRGGSLVKNFGLTPGKIGSKASSNISKLYSRNVSPLLRKSSSFGLKMTKEGMEEMVQESFEEWSKIEAYRDKFGTTEGYQGKITKEYERGGLLSAGFLDYLQSSDSEGIRTIAFGVGAMAGGAFNVKTLFNKEADGARQMIDRTENLRTQFEEGSEGKTYQRKHIYSQIAELIYDGKQEHFGGFIQGLNQDGIVSDQEMNHYEEAYNKMAETNDETELMDMMGKKAFMNNVVAELYHTESIEIENEASKKRIESFRKNITSPEILKRKIDQENKNLKLKIDGLKYNLAQIKINKENLIDGGKATDIDNILNPKETGNQSDVTTGVPQAPKNFRGKVKDYFDGLGNLFKSSKEQDEEIAVEEPDGDIIEEIENPQEFIQSAKVEDIINVEGQNAVITGINKNAEGIADNIDYEIDNKEKTKGNVRVTKDNTFNDDRANRKTTISKVTKATPKPKAKTPEEAVEGKGRQAIEKGPQKQTRFPNIINDNKTIEVTPEVYKEFIDTGKVPSGVIKNIATKISKDEKLSLEEEAIRQAETEAINSMLNKASFEEDYARKLEKSGDQKVQDTTEKIANEKQLNKNIPKEKEARQLFNEKKEQAFEKTKEGYDIAVKTLKDLQKKVSDNLTPIEKAKLKKQITNAKRQATRLKNKLKTFGIDAKKIGKGAKKIGQKIWQGVENTAESVANAIDDSLSETDGMTDEEIEEVRKLKAKKGKAWADKAIQQAKDYANRAYRATFSAIQANRGYFNQRTANPSNGWFETAELMTVNEKIGQMFPDVMPRVYTMDNLYKGIGIKGVGYALGSALFIQQNKWNQGKVFMHELSHVYFALTQEDDTTKALLRLAMKDAKLVAEIKAKYDHDIYYRTKGGFAETKLELLGDDYNRMSVEERAAAINSKIKNGEIKEIPDMQQPIITEEAFVAKLEGDLNSEYTKLFEKKNEPKRQFYVKKWWGKLKNRAIEAQRDFVSGESSFLKTLSKAEGEEYVNSKNFIIDQFSKTTKGIDVSASGREARIKADKNTKAKDLIDIRTRRVENQKEFIGKPETKSKFDEFLIQEEIEEDARDLDSQETYDPERTFHKQSLKFVTKAQKLIRQFNNSYGLALTKRYYLENREKIIDWSKMPIYNGDNLQIKLKELSHEAISADEFIYFIESSDLEEVYSFNTFLDGTRDDKETFLAGYWHLNRNTEQVNGLKMFVDKDGNVSVESGMNYREQASYERSLDKLYLNIGSYIKGGKQTGVSPLFDIFKDAADNIRSGKFTDYDIAKVLRFFTPPITDVGKIIENGVINSDGNIHTVDQFVYGFLTTEEGFGGRGENSLYIPGTRTLKPGVRRFMKAIITSNRPYTAEYTILDANKNLKPSQQVNNSLLTITKNMNNDALKMELPAFIRKYGQVSKKLRKEKTGKSGNQILQKIHEDARAGKPIAINTYDGVTNQQTNSSSVLKTSNATEQSYNELAMYLSSGFKGGKNKATYLMDLGRFSNSPRAFIMEVPKLNYNEVLETTADGRMRIREEKPIFKTSYAILKNSGYPGSFKQYIKGLENAINNEVRFINKNGDINNRLNQISALTDKNGRLTADGTKRIAQFVMNQHLNQQFYTEIYTPSYKGKNLVKRAKQVTSPSFKNPPNVKMEAIPIMDNMEGETALTDGAMYMRTEDIERMATLGGNVMPLGKGIKGLAAGVEYNNSVFAGQNIYHKGYIFGLNEEYVKNHPELKGVWKMLGSRKDTYKGRVPNYSDDLTADIPTYIPYAYHISADKTLDPDKIPSHENFTATDGSRTTMRDHFSLENINSGNLSEINNYLDTIYYDKGQENFIGLSGENFGIQQVMDKVSTESIMSVQLIRAIGTNATINGSLEQAEELQGTLAEMMQDNLARIDEVLKSNDAIEIRKLILEGMNLEEMDPIQAMSIKNDNLSFNTPELRVIARNQLSNIVRMTGNKLKTPGALLQQRPDHYQNPHGNTNGSKNLSFYTSVSPEEKKLAEKFNLVEGENKGVKFSTVQTRNNIKTSTRMGEAVVSNFMKGEVTARKYFTFKTVREGSGDMNTFNSLTHEQQLYAMRDAAFDEAQKQNKNVGIVLDGINQPIGFYVEGDTIIGTRIPAHGPQSTGVFEVIDFSGLESSDIELPAEFTLGTTGGDFDGDAVFVQHKYKKGSRHKNAKKWNGFMDKFQSYWLTPEMQLEVAKEIDHGPTSRAAKAKVEAQFGVTEMSITGTPEQRRKDYDNTMSTTESIGIVANAHSIIGMLSTYETPLKKEISINGFRNNIFQDVKDDSRTINSANLFQIVLDNPTDQMAEVLGINKQTSTIAVILTNLGYNLDEISLILNTDVVKEYVKLKSDKDNVFSTESRSDFMKALRTKFSINKTDDIDIKTDDVNSPTNHNAIINLLESTGAINNDLMKINGIMSQHNKIEINPFELRQQKEDFENIIKNINSEGLEIPSGFENNPLVQNYLKTVDVVLGYQEKIDPVYRQNSSDLYETFINGSPFHYNKDQRQAIYNLMELFHTARSMGFNNLPKEHLQNLTKNKHADNIFDRLQAHIDKMELNVVEFDENTRETINELERSLLFTHLINFNSKGNNKFISLNTSYFKENISNLLRQSAIQEFQALPVGLKNDLILYDLMTNGFKSGKSLFPIFSPDFRGKISKAADDDIQQKDIISTPKPTLNTLMKNILSENPDLADQSRGKKNPNMFKKMQDGTFELSTVELSKSRNTKIRKRLHEGKPFFFKQGERIYHFKGLDGSDQNRMNIAKTDFQKNKIGAKLFMENFEVFEVDKSNYNEGIIAIPDNNQDPFYDWERDDETRSWEDELKKKSEDTGRAAIGDVDTSYWKYEKSLSRQEFDGVMNYDRSVPSNQKQSIYNTYLEDKVLADKVALTINEESVKTMTREQLHDNYAKYGQKDKFAYTNVLNPITYELAQRIGRKQSIMLADKGNPGQEYDGTDINAIQKLLMANNVPSKHPAVQGTVRTLENSYKHYQEERVKYVKKINKATNALYQEKFGYNAIGGNIIDRLKVIWTALTNINNRDSFYKQLYGNLLVVHKVKDPDTGKELTKIKYKPKAQIEEEFKNGDITKAEYEFFETTTAISKELEPYVVKKGKKGRADYIPHVAPDLMERFSRRGLLGVLVHSKSIHQQIYEVQMDFINPVTGKLEENMNFKYIEDVYNALSFDKNINKKHSLEFIKLKRKANALYKSGNNENGTPIKYSKIAIGSAIGDIFMNDFQGENGARAQDLPSFDLNKAFTDYTDSALYTFGNGKFTGMKKMLPLIDGLLVQAHRDQNPELEAYVDKTWRQYFMSGKKQKISYNSNTLLAVGVTSDDVIDFITKGSLMYWLGYKGLAIGGGAYAIGNVLVGKYHNLKNAGGKAFAKGENRFWFGKNGKINWREPLKGLEESQTILKNIGFLDINIYDEVGIHKKNSLDTMLSGLALGPMIRSERWIQGSHFLGLLTDGEWEHLKNGGKLEKDRLNEIEEEVKTSHGKGYQPTDQRMLQLYSWGRTMLQFSRYLPTMVYDRMAKKDINRYGNLHMGAYRAVAEPIQRMVTGEMSIKDFKFYYDTLDPQQKKRFNSGIIGFGFMASLLGIQQVGIENKYADDLYWDANSMIDFQKLQRKMTPPSVAMIDQLTSF